MPGGLSERQSPGRAPERPGEELECRVLPFVDETLASASERELAKLGLPTGLRRPPIKDFRVEPERGGILRLTLPQGLIHRRTLMSAAGHVLRQPPSRRRVPQSLPDRAVKDLASSWFSAWPSGLLQWISPEAAALHEEHLARFVEQSKCRRPVYPQVQRPALPADAPKTPRSTNGAFAPAAPAAVDAADDAGHGRGVGPNRDRQRLKLLRLNPSRSQNSRAVTPAPSNLLISMRHACSLRRPARVPWLCSFHDRLHSMSMEALFGHVQANGRTPLSYRLRADQATA